jgi:secreted trypsin-like serine protease
MITNNVICAGASSKSEDACFGDSGGPLVVRWDGDIVQVGVVSWGARDGCGLADLYGVYVRLSEYADWIAAKIK